MDRQSARENAKDAKREEFDELQPELDLLVHRVIGAAIEVHKAPGPGLAPVHLAQVLS